MPHTSPRPPSTAWNFVDSVLFVAGIVVCKLALELSPFVRQWQAQTIATLEQRLSPPEDAYRLPVVVFDISGIHPEAAANGAPVIPRESIRALLDAFDQMNFRPRAIGIDIDFSSDDSGRPVDPADDALFEKAAEMEKNGAPVYFGVMRQAFAAPGTWLPVKGSDEFAGGMLRGSVAWRVPMESAGRPGQALPSLAERLAERLLPAAGPETGAGGIYSFGALASEYSRIDYPWHGEVTERTIDLSPLDALRDGRVRVLKGYEKAAVAMAEERLHNAVAIIGDGAVRNQEDAVIVGGFTPAILPGVLFQACAVVTAWRGHLYELTPLGRLLADMTLGLGVLGLVTFISSAYERHSLHAGAVHWLVTLLVVAAVVCTGYWLVPYTRLLWIDFDLVAAVLLLHAPAERAFHRLRKALSSLFFHRNPGTH